jgi:DNA invertase Pin-like site-specific DNA recombinase
MSAGLVLKINGPDRAKGCAYNFRMKIGYARVSKDEQNLARNCMRSALRAARGCFRIKGYRGGASVVRPGLLADLEGAREDGIDTNTAAGRMVFSMVGAIAEFERSVISERTKAGMAAARRRGRHVGRPAKLVPDQLDYARRMVVEGEGRAQSPAPSASIPRRCGGCS